jgi:hypothetical protein
MMRRLAMIAVPGAGAGALLAIAFQFPIAGAITAAVVVLFVAGLFALIMSRAS